MERIDIIKKIGRDYLVSNIESGEFSFQKALSEKGKDISEIANPNWHRRYKDIDLRFTDGQITILVETKANFDKENIEQVFEQLYAYTLYEKQLTGNKVVAILANINDDRLKVWYGDDLEITSEFLDDKQYELKSFEEYYRLYFSKDNDKIKVMQNTYKLNDTLHKFGINEKIRSQFVGTCLLALKNGLTFEGLSSGQIIAGIEGILSELLDRDLEKAYKLSILKNKVLDSQDIRDLSSSEFEIILKDIDSKILPYINESSTQGQDLLSLFFTTFNKYVGKADKNQAFTPNHIVHFMCQAVGVNRNSRILDPCSGSGAFLVRSMDMALNDAQTDAERKKIKKEQIYGYEFDETAFGLSTTNMLIHGDGNSNIKQGNVFKYGKEIRDNNINIVLMNPPYNAQKKHSNPEYSKNWSKSTNTDPSKGFHFVHFIASQIKTGRLATLLPMSCAIGGNSKEIVKFKEKMLQEHTLEAVFSMPSDIFHPGANVASCCMIFNLGTRHEKAPIKETFFGYYKNDGFTKRKNIGRVEILDDQGVGLWENIQSEWLETYHNRREVTGLSVLKEVTYKDEWLAEAYMETDYSMLNDVYFENKIRDFLAFEILNGKINMNEKIECNYEKIQLTDREWVDFYIDRDTHKNKGLFSLEPVKGETTDLLEEGSEIPYIGAKGDLNGFMKLVSKNKNLEYVSEGNCIVFVSLGAGSAGYSTYQPREFIGMSGKIMTGYNENLNTTTGLFISAVLDLERPKYSFGRSWSGDKLKDTKIKLPSRLIEKTNKDGKVIKEWEPDWEFIDQYMKQLEYGVLL